MYKDIQMKLRIKIYKLFKTNNLKIFVLFYFVFIIFNKFKIHSKKLFRYLLAKM